MATYEVSLYNDDPFFIFSRSSGGTATWTGPATADGTATITDTETGIEEFTLDDDNAGGESATATVTIGGNTSTNVNVDAEESWTLRDTVTGQEFQVVTFEVEGGDADGYYTLSEVPLVVGRTYETLAFDNNPNAAAGDPAFNINDYVNPDGIVDGTANADVIDALFTDADGDQVDDASGNNNVVYAGSGDDRVEVGLGDDSVEAGTGADTVLGGTGSDTVLGEDGADSIFGDDGDFSNAGSADSLIGGAGNDSIFGEAGNDTIDGGADNDSLEGGAGSDSVIGGSGNDTIGGGADADTIDAGTGDDSIDGGTGADSIAGGVGNDTIVGGTGADTIQGDGGTGGVEVLDWSLQGADGTNVAAGFTQNTGDVDVSVSFSNDGDNAPTFTIERTDTNYVEDGEEFDPNSSLFLFGTGDAATSTSTLDFAAATGAQVEDEVQNVSFRINDIDFATGNHQDLVTVNAIDASGAPVSVTITPAGNDTVAGNTITAALTGESSADAAGSVLVEITGPLSQIEIVYANGLNGTQGINVTDVYFETIPTVAASSDVIDGGADNDVIDGMVGNDTITGGSGNDTMTGGAGDDVFVLADGSGNDVITDFDTGDSDSDGSFNDQLDVSSLTDADGNPVNAWDVVVSDDGFGNALLTFPNLETITLEGVAPAAVTGAQLLNAAGIPCFAAGTLIATPSGEVPIETLAVGDMVLTKDHGPQPLRWAGSRRLGPRELLAFPEHKPIVIPEGVLGNHSPLLVSPLLGMFLGPETVGEEVLVRAMHLAEASGPVRIAHGKKRVTYHHLFFDAHQIVFANGCPAESFYPGPYALGLYPVSEIKKIKSVVPGLGDVPVEQCYGPTARRFLKRREVLEHVDLRSRRIALSLAAE